MADVPKIMKITRSLDKLNKLGGRDSFFGMQHIFEEILYEAHKKAGETCNGMYCFHGMEEYGNIVSPEAVKNAYEICKNEYGFTNEEIQSLVDWYKGRSIDASILSVCLKVELRR